MATEAKPRGQRLCGSARSSPCKQHASRYAGGGPGRGRRDGPVAGNPARTGAGGPHRPRATSRA